MKLKAILLVLSSLGLTAHLPAEALDLMGSQWRGTTLKKTTSEVKNGNFSYRWDAFGSSYFRINDVSSQDWNQFNELSFWAYSEEKTDAIIAIGVYGETQPGGTSGISYYVHRLTVDWEGWKQIKVSLSDFIPVRSPLGWSDVSYVKIMSNYGTQPVAGTVLYFNDFKLEE